jgi:hypothetical protein
MKAFRVQVFWNHLVSCVNVETVVIMYASGGIVSMGTTSGKGVVQKNNCNRVENSRG